MKEVTVIYDSITLVLRGQYFEGCEGNYMDAPEPTDTRVSHLDICILWKARHNRFTRQ